MAEPEKPYGYHVICEFRDRKGRPETRSFRSKGSSETKARRVPIFKRGFIRVVDLDPFTQEQWERTFGVSGLRM